MVGLIGKKLGMTQVFDEQGALVPVSIIQVDENVVVGERQREKHGYSALIIGTGIRKKSKVTKPYGGQFPEDIEPAEVLKEIRGFDSEGAEAKDVKIGDRFGVEVFEGIRFVDVSGISKGRGYQGVMKRHGFRGGRKTHGSKFHRAGGSTGQAASPSKVLKGTKMAGRMGGEKKTVQNLRLVKIDPEKKLLLVGGPIPGRRGARVIVTRAKKKQR